MANRRCPISTVNSTAGAGRPHHATQRNGRNFSSCILKIIGQKAGKVYQLHLVVNPVSIQPQRNTVIERRPSVGVRSDLCPCLLITLRWRCSRVTVRRRTFPNIIPIDKMIGIPADGLYLLRLHVAVDLIWSRVIFAGENRWFTVTVCLDIETVWFHGAFYVCFAFRIMSYSPPHLLSSGPGRQDRFFMCSVLILVGLLFDCIEICGGSTRSTDKPAMFCHYLNVECLKYCWQAVFLCEDVHFCTLRACLCGCVWKNSNRYHFTSWSDVNIIFFSPNWRNFVYFKNNWWHIHITR